MCVRVCARVRVSMGHLEDDNDKGCLIISFDTSPSSRLQADLHLTLPCCLPRPVKLIPSTRRQETSSDCGQLAILVANIHRYGPLYTRMVGFGWPYFWWLWFDPGRMRRERVQQTASCLVTFVGRVVDISRIGELCGCVLVYELIACEV